jgi:hypothetical protein
VFSMLSASLCTGSSSSSSGLEVGMAGTPSEVTRWSETESLESEA